MTKFFHRTDPGHGWVSVSRKLIDKLGIAADITPYSYQKGGTVYLEEDNDASTFYDAAVAAGMTVEFVTTYTDRTPIRGYASYTVTAPPTPAAIRAIVPGDRLRLRNEFKVGTLTVTHRGRYIVAGGYQIKPGQIAEIIAA